MKGKGEEHYNDNAANYFILFVLAIITIPSTFVYLKNRFSTEKDDSARCSCKDCKGKQAAANAKKSNSPRIGTIFKGALLVVLWAIFVNVLLTSTSTEQAASSGYFDPYTILGLEPVCINTMIFNKNQQQEKEKRKRREKKKKKKKKIFIDPFFY